MKKALQKYLCKACAGTVLRQKYVAGVRGTTIELIHRDNGIALLTQKMVIFCSPDGAHRRQRIR